MKKMIVVMCLVAVVAMMGLVGVRDANATSFFSATQYMSVVSTGWNYTALYNFNTSTWSSTSWHYGNNSFSYSLPYYAWFCLMVWDDYYGKWDELVYVYDVNN